MHYIKLVLSGFYAPVAEQRIGNADVGVTRNGVVIDCSKLVSGRGIAMGMSAKEAKVISPETKWVKWVESDYAAESDAWLAVCAEFSDCIEPDDQHSAFIDLSNHPDPQLATNELLSRLNYSCAYSFCDSKWIGDALCRSGISRVGDLPTQLLLPVGRVVRDELVLLGYHTFQEIQALPLSILAEHFGEDALLIHRACRGGIRQPVDAVYPRGVMRSRTVFDSPMNSEGTLDLAMKTMSREIGERLSERDLHAARLRMTWILADGQRVEHARNFSRRMQSPSSLLASLRLIANNLHAESPEAPQEVRVEVDELGEANRNQLQLDKLSKSDPLVSLDKVKSVFGDRSIQIAAHMAVPRRASVMKAWKHATGWL